MNTEQKLLLFKFPFLIPHITIAEKLYDSVRPLHYWRLGHGIHHFFADLRDKHLDQSCITEKGGTGFGAQAVCLLSVLPIRKEYMLPIHILQDQSIPSEW